MKLLDPKKGEKIVDLGSGNGKILFEIAARGATAYGYEINPLLVWRTRWQAKRLGIDKNVKVYWKSFWDVDLRQDISLSNNLRYAGTREKIEKRTQTRYPHRFKLLQVPKHETSKK